MQEKIVSIFNEGGVNIFCLCHFILPYLSSTIDIGNSSKGFQRPILEEIYVDFNFMERNKKFKFCLIDIKKLIWSHASVTSLSAHSNSKFCQC